MRNHHAQTVGLRAAWLAALLGLGLVSGAQAESSVCITEDVPVDRLLANLEARAVQSSDSWEAQYVLGRAYSIAYARKTPTLSACTPGLDGSQTPELSDRLDLGYEHRQPEVVAVSPANRAEAEDHLARAVAAYQRAVALAPDKAIVRIGHAWVLEQAQRPGDAVNEYRAAIRLAWPADRDANERRLERDGSPVFTLGVQPGYVFLTEEAIRHLIPLLDSTRDAAEIDELTQRRTFIQRGPRPISPIVVPLRRDAALSELVDRSARVTFDLDGFGPRTWNWITPDAGWLVFDPRGTGRITSGLQLFGNVTFWLFWNTGYDALQALDDDGDGLLRGDELVGLAVWRDANVDGVSQPGEVHSLASLGVVELATKHVIEDENDDVLAYAPGGVHFSDGSTRTTYDVLLQHADRGSEFSMLALPLNAASLECGVPTGAGASTRQAPPD